MKQDMLVRFGVAMEDSLLAEFDAVVTGRGSTRSKALRDLARAEISRSKSHSHVPAVAALTIVYDHHVRDLADTLTEMQHDLGERVRSTMHVHLSHSLCLEVIILQGHADELKASADRLLGARGVSHGGLEMFALDALTAPPAHEHAHSHGDLTHTHAHDKHSHSHGEHSAHAPPHAHAHEKSRDNARAVKAEKPVKTRAESTKSK